MLRASVRLLDEAPGKLTLLNSRTAGSFVVSNPRTIFGATVYTSRRLCTPAADPPIVRLCEPRSQLSVFSTLHVVVFRGAGEIVCDTPLPVLAGKLSA